MRDIGDEEVPQEIDTEIGDEVEVEVPENAEGILDHQKRECPHPLFWTSLRSMGSTEG